MIDENAKIVEVRRVYESNYESDCIDLPVGECFATADGLQDISWSEGTYASYEQCFVIAMTPDAEAQFAHLFGYVNFKSSWWFAVEDTIPVDDETDARLRAMVALLEECPVMLDGPLS